MLRYNTVYDDRYKLYVFVVYKIEPIYARKQVGHTYTSACPILLTDKTHLLLFGCNA